MDVDKSTLSTVYIPPPDESDSDIGEDELLGTSVSNEVQSHIPF